MLNRGASGAMDVQNILRNQVEYIDYLIPIIHLKLINENRRHGGVMSQLDIHLSVEDEQMIIVKWRDAQGHNSDTIINLSVADGKLEIAQINGIDFQPIWKKTIEA